MLRGGIHVIKIAHFVMFIASIAVHLGKVAYADVAEKAMDAKEWFDSLDAKKLASLKMPHRVAVVQSFQAGGTKSGVPKFLIFPDAKCQDYAFFSCAKSANSQFGVAINDPAKIGGLQGVTKLTDADVVVYGEGDKVRVAAGGAIGNSDIELKEMKAEGVSQFVDETLSGLGYDGVVLDNDRKGFVLVGSTLNKLKGEGLQALSIGKSSDKLLITNANRKGAALLSMVSSSGMFAVFQIVNLASDGSDIEPGSKIILEEAKR